MVLCTLAAALHGSSGGGGTNEEPRQEWMGLDEFEITVLAGMVTFLIVARVIGQQLVRQALSERSERVLRLSRLNTTVVFKEVFVNYLCAAILDPVLAIAGQQAVVGKQMVVNLATLGGILWWIFLLTDAFDTADTSHAHKYTTFREEVEKEPAKFSWLVLETESAAKTEELGDLEGTHRRDVALWFLLISIAAAFAGVVSHRDVVHAWVLVVFWVVLHHHCRSCTCWGAPYLVSLILPSTALMPLEFCLPLREVEDLEALSSWRSFVRERCGVDLIIHA